MRGVAMIANIILLLLLKSVLGEEWESLEFEEARLEANWVVTSCASFARATRKNPMTRRVAMASDEAARSLGLVGECGACCVNAGTPTELIGAACGLRRSENATRRWFAEVCGTVEVGWVTSGDATKIWWVDGGSKVYQADLDRETPHWQSATLGQVFEVDGNRYEVSGDSVFVVETVQPEEGSSRPFPEEAVVVREEARTARGYEKVRAPYDVFGDMSAYWFENRARLSYEEVRGRRLVAHVPPRLKAKWFEAVRPMVEKWIGRELEKAADISGMRVYGNGSVVSPRVEPGVSAMINIDQAEMKDDWNVSVKDATSGDFVEVPLAPGDLFMYEARLAGMPRPMNGGGYVAMHARYRFLTKEDDDEEEEPRVKNWRQALKRPTTPPPPTTTTTKKKQKLRYVHARKLKSRWHKVLDAAGFYAVASFLGLVFLLCCAVATRRARRKKTRFQRLQRDSRPSEGSASPRRDKSRYKALPPGVRQAARSNRGLSVVERWLSSSRKAADARDAEPPRRALLHHAAAHGAAAIARVCASRGADPNLVDDAGDAPLHLAAVAGSGAVVKILLEAGALPDLPDALSKTPLDRAREANNTGCALLISKKLDANRRRHTSDNNNNNNNGVVVARRLRPEEDQV